MKKGLTLIELLIVCGIISTLCVSFVLFTFNYNEAYFKNKAWAELCAQVLKLKNHLRLDVEKVGGNIKWVNLQKYGVQDALPAPMYFRVRAEGIVEEGEVSAKDFSRIRMLFRVIDTNGNPRDGRELLEFSSCPFPADRNFIISYSPVIIARPSKKGGYTFEPSLIKHTRLIDGETGRIIERRIEEIIREHLFSIKFDAEPGSRVLRIWGTLHNRRHDLWQNFAFALKITGENGTIER